MVFKVIRQYFKATDRAYIATCVFCSVLSVITLISLGQAAGGFARDAFDGSITGLGLSLIHIWMRLSSTCSTVTCRFS